MSEIENLVEQSLAQTVSPPPSNIQGGLHVFQYLARAGMSMFPWWSPSRDIQLMNFWKQVDYLSGAIYTMESKMSAIPVKVQARDQSIVEHVREAEDETERLLVGAEFGGGWSSFYEKFVEALVTQDNGTFAEIIGAGQPDGPIIGRPVTVRTLDPALCLGRDTRVRMADGSTMSILRIVRNKIDRQILSVDESGKVVFNKIIGWHETPLGNRYWIHITLKDACPYFGRKETIWVTNDHQILTQDGWKRVDAIKMNDIICTEYPQPSKDQMEFICGSLLGDGHLVRQTLGRKSSFSMTQGIKQLEWLILKRQALSGFKVSEIKRNIDTTYCYTNVSPFFSKLRSLWYPDGKKRVPRDLIEKYFSPLLLATWFMDDGNTINGKWGRPKVRFYTNSFPEDDVEWLADLLTRNGIKSHIKSLVNTTGKTEYFIYVSADGVEVLFNTISAYVPSVLRYKIPSQYKSFDKTLWNLGPSDLYYGEIEKIERKPLDQKTAYCIDVENTHNFIAAGMVVHNCQRTGHPIYPVIYHDMTSGKLYKLHFTRVMYKAQMESTIAQMFGVGFCSISRAINTSQSLLDILIYKQEKLGSRPRRGIIVTGGGLDPENVSEAFRIVESIEDSQSLSRYSKMAVVGDSSLPEAKLELMDLSSLPDGFDERDNVELGMAVIAMALGMDARELFPALEAGATRADALIQHLKQRGKGPGQIIQMTELMFNSKYLPPHLKLVFDFQDDEEDRQSAETKEIRSRRWATSIKDGSMDNHTARAQMVEVGDLERGQFERLELEDGRLADGTSVLALFYSDDPQIKKLIDLNIDNPLDIESNVWASLKPSVDKQSSDAMTIIVNSSNPDERWVAHKALAALRELRKLYGQEDFLDTKPPELPPSANDGTTQKDPRLRKVDLLRPNAPKIDTDELEPETDEERIKEAGGIPVVPF